MSGLVVRSDEERRLRYHSRMATRQRTARGRATTRSHRWEDLRDPELLDIRFRDLRLRVGNSSVQPEVHRLYAELERRGIRFRPHVWLSTEWFSPDGVPGIAVPFFAAHPRLCRLERRMMGEVEGATSRWRLRILRHEAGHALDNAFRLRRRADWREVFGNPSKPYPRDYSVRPGSRRYVLHIGYWYAQSHPTEDFAETFAVWMQPRARWRRDYAGWPALRKLEYMDTLMAEIAGRRPLVRDRSVVEPLSGNNLSLREHYRRKSADYEHVERRYDPWLEHVFVSRSSRPEAVPAGRFIREVEPQLKRSLIRRTKANPYLADHVITTITQRVRQLDLVVGGSRRDTFRPALRLHEQVVSDVLRRNREKYVL